MGRSISTENRQVLQLQGSKKKFRVGDLVLRRVFLNTRDPAAGVLGPNWEGPYQIEDVLDPGTYKLARLNGELVPRYWNDEHLRKYYQ